MVPMVTNFQNSSVPRRWAGIADNYVVADLDVLEEAEKKPLENPEGEALMLNYRRREFRSSVLWVSRRSRPGRSPIQRDARPLQYRISVHPRRNRRVDGIARRAAPRLDPRNATPFLPTSGRQGSRSYSDVRRLCTSTPTVAPYGAWVSTIDAANVAFGSMRLSFRLDQSRPMSTGSNAGRTKGAPRPGQARRPRPHYRCDTRGLERRSRVLEDSVRAATRSTAALSTTSTRRPAAVPSRLGPATPAP